MDIKDWMANRWKAGLAFVYSLVCVFDFIVVPGWIGWHRVGILDLMEAMKDMPIDLQRDLLTTAFRQHVPFTLQNSGLIHIAFGALLTGAAISREPKRHDD